VLGFALEVVGFALDGAGFNLEVLSLEELLGTLLLCDDTRSRLSSVPKSPDTVFCVLI